MPHQVRHILLVALVLASGAGFTASVRPAAADEQRIVTRIFIADANSTTVRVLDAASGSELASFSTPTVNPNLYASSSGRWVYAVHTAANRVSILDSGLRLTDHGDHQDLTAGPPFVRGTVLTGRRPIDFWTQDGMATVHNDDDGTLALFDDERLEVALDYTEIRGAGTGHNNAVVQGGDTVLLSHASTGVITAYTVDGRVLQQFEDCPGTHGWTVRGSLAAAGCADGVMLFTKVGESVTARKVAEPSGSPETARVSTLVSHPASPALAGNFGNGLALLSPDAAVLQVVPLPSAPVTFRFTAGGSRLLVLTRDGMLHTMDPLTGTIQASLLAVTPMPTGEGAPPVAALAVAGDLAYLTDPQAGRLILVDTTTMTMTRTVNVGGVPRGIAVVSAFGVAD